MPKMGESISEATIISWLKNVGDFVEAEETILEVATDKVDSDVPAPVSGVITEIRFQKDDVVEVGTVLALIDSDGKTETRSKKQDVSEKNSVKASAVEVEQPKTENRKLTTNPNAFISPLIISIAQKENLSIEELQTIPGSGAEGRLQKSDVFNYLKNRKYPLCNIPSKSPFFLDSCIPYLKFFRASSSNSLSRKRNFFTYMAGFTKGTFMMDQIAQIDGNAQ